MASQVSHGSLAARLSHLYGNIRNCFSQQDELRQLDPEMQARIASDLALSPSRLLHLSDTAADAATEMEALMRALRIDPPEVRLASPGQFRDMQVNCALCENKDACRRDLASGAITEHYVDYCSNSEELSALRAQPRFLAD
ncbi:DUF6455 family protein [Rhizobium helianthi]|uniref:DUF6455 family protein n=1 Tax=Rhizobium helianthi TaxID=1132695 RepID=A0ABW4LZB0_9HYPH